PKRGEIIVSDTHGIDRLPLEQQNTFYIKRLDALRGDKLRLEKNHLMNTVPVAHLGVNAQPVSASTPHFENLYSYSGAPPTKEVLGYRENQYFGHAMLEGLSPGSELEVAPHHYFVMGDNTFNSSDSRYWGDFPQEKVIGKSFFVYWPLTE